MSHVIDNDGNTDWKLVVRESNRTGQLELEATKPIPYDGVLRYSTEKRAYVSYRKNSKFNLTPSEVVNYYVRKSDTESAKDQLYADAMELVESEGEIVKECRMPNCENPRGMQDRDDYRSRFCSIQCDVTFDKRKMDAREARLADMEEHNER